MDRGAGLTLWRVGSSPIFSATEVRLLKQMAPVLAKAYGKLETAMLEPVEHFFRGFGGKQTPYFSISRSGMRARSLLAARSTQQALVRRWRRGSASRRSSDAG